MYNGDGTVAVNQSVVNFGKAAALIDTCETRPFATQQPQTVATVDYGGHPCNSCLSLKITTAKKTLKVAMYTYAIKLSICQACHTSIIVHEKDSRHPQIDIGEKHTLLNNIASAYTTASAHTTVITHQHFTQFFHCCIFRTPPWPSAYRKLAVRGYAENSIQMGQKHALVYTACNLSTVLQSCC